MSARICDTCRRFTRDPEHRCGVKDAPYVPTPPKPEPPRCDRGHVRPESGDCSVCALQAAEEARVARVLSGVFEVDGAMYYFGAVR